MLQLIGVLIAFFLVILLIRFKINFGFALLIGSLILAIFSINVINITTLPQEIIQDQKFLIDTLELTILMTLIYMLAKMMQKTGAISKLIDSLRTIFTKGGTIGVIPAIYGLMPVPGGALFSAPVVQEEGHEYNMHVDKKNFFNIWFRHIWFPVYPISITILTMAKLAEIEVTDLIKGNFLSYIFMVILGFIILSLTVKKNTKNKTLKKIDLDCIKKECHGLLFLLPPIIPVFFAVFHYIFNISLEISFILGVSTSIVVLLYLVKTPKNEYKNLLKKSITWKFALVIIGIMVFRKIFEYTQSNQAIFSTLESFNIPILLMIIILPLLLGIITGYLLIGITLTYPLLAPFYPATDLTIIGFASLIFMSAFVGYLISPIHLCNILSSEYLKTDTTKMYPVFIPAALSLLVFHIIIVLTFF
jgi:uncharacterized protein